METSGFVFGRRLAKRELKLVAKNVLEALHDLHADRWIYADLEPSNILINRSEDDKVQITDAQLSDLEDAVPDDAVPEDHSTPLDGTTEGTCLFLSPEYLLELPWSTPTDIWSFGATMLSLIHGYDFQIFKPHDYRGYDPYYSRRILERHNGYFGPFPASYAGITDWRTMRYIAEIMQNKPVDFPRKFDPYDRESITESMEEALVPRHYSLASTFPDICASDREFILRIMKLDPRERPTAEEWLQDVWFDQDEQSGSLEDQKAHLIWYYRGRKRERSSCEDYN